ncbi:MAG TPA: peptide ABC transporter substrate-binding protein [Chloroflexia bacterium]|nr:peptide ABC transporter substrate-binding protein [Chloroflexia bacterium]
MFSKKLAVVALFVLMMPFFAACGPETPAANPTATTGPAAEATATTAPAVDATATTGTAEGTATTGSGGEVAVPAGAFSWRAYAEPETMDPALMQENLSIEIGQNVYDSLVEFDPLTLKIQPALAEALPEVSADGTVYTFKLRKDAKFSNGDPVTSADVKYSWNRALTTPAAPYLFVMDDIKGAQEVVASTTSTDTTKPKVTEATGIETPDAQTVKITLKNPSAYFLSQLTVWTYYVVNKKAVDKGGEWMIGPGAGTGAYYIESWKHDQSLSLKPNTNYWGAEKATVDAFVPIIKDTTTAQAQFERGDLSVLDAPSPADLERIQKDATLGKQLFKVGQARAVWIGLNVMKGPFSPLNDEKAMKLRQAISYAIDRDQLIELALSGAAQPLTTLMPEGEPCFAKADIYPFDAAKAKQLLSEAGYPNGQGLSLTYTYRQRDAEQRVAEQIQAQLKENLGLDIKVAGVEWKDMLAARQDHQYEMFYGSWGHDYPDPQNWFYALFHSSQIKGVGPGSGNDPGYKNDEFDKLVAQANVLADPTKFAERCKLYQQAEQILLKDAPLVPLYQVTRYWESSPKFTGYAANNSFAYPFRMVKPAK